MSSMNDLISRVLLPNTVEDLKRRLDAGRESGWYETSSTANTNCSRADKRKLSSEKSDDHRKLHKENQNSSKEINKFSHGTESSVYVNSSNGENLTWDSLNKVVKDKVQCPDCGKVFYNEVKLPENFLKVYANSIANNDSNVNNHAQPSLPNNVLSLPSAAEPQRYECYICDRVFSLKENYAKHLKKHLNVASSSKNKCDICSKSFVNESTLLNHYLEHKANTCIKCGKSFPDKWKYERHYKTHLHKCQLCEKIFVKKCYLKKHMMSSHGVQDMSPYEKPNQPKAVNSNNCKMIVSVKPEIDEESNAVFAIKPEEASAENNQNNMAVVPYVAKPEYKNVCHLCGKSFKDKWKLKQHLVIHSGEKAWACNFCTQRFYFKYGLSRHIKNVHLSKDQTIDLNEVVKKDNMKQE